MDTIKKLIKWIVISAIVLIVAQALINNLMARWNDPKIAQLETEVTRLQGLVEDKDRQLVAKTELVTSLQTRMLALSAVDTDAGKARAMILGLQETVGEQQSKLHTVNAEVERLRNENRVLTDHKLACSREVQTFRDQLFELGRMKNAILADKSKLEAEIAALSSDSALRARELQTANQRLERQVGDLTTANTVLEAYVASMRTDFEVAAVGLQRADRPFVVKFRLQGTTEWTHEARLDLDGSQLVRTKVQPIRDKASEKMLAGEYEYSYWFEGRQQGLVQPAIKVYPQGMSSTVTLDNGQRVRVDTETFGHLIIAAPGAAIARS